jgi:hypothetical protein
MATEQDIPQPTAMSRSDDPLSILAHMLDGFPAPRLAFERRGHSLAGFAQVRTAAFAADARRRIDDALARKIVRQRPARRLDPCPLALLFLLLGSGDLCLGLFLGLRFLEIGDGELQLLDELLAALRGLPGLLPPGLTASMRFSRSISCAQTAASLRASANISRCARIIAWAAARSAGSGPEGVITIRFNHIRNRKSCPVYLSHKTTTALSGRPRTPGFLRHSPIDAVEKVSHLSGADCHHADDGGRPKEAAPLQSLCEQAGALSIVPNDLDQVTATASKNKQIAVKRIAFQRLLHTKSKPWKSVSHVRMAGR